MAKLNVFPKALNNFGENKDPIRNLWRNVLIVALEDALGRGINGGNLRGNKNYQASLPITDAAAKAYFLDPNWDFQLVCQLAGFDHRYVRMKVRRKFESCPK